MPPAPGPNGSLRGSPDRLSAVTAFAALAPPLLEQIADIAAVVQLAAGETLFGQGDADDAMFVVLSGHLVEETREEEHVGVTRTLTRGGVLDERALFAEGRRSASVRALRPSVLARIERDRFAALLASEPGLAGTLVQSLGVRERRPLLGRPARRAGAVVIAVTALDPGAPVLALAMELSQGLCAHGTSALVLPARRADPEAASPDAPPEEAATDHASLVERLEREHDRVVLACGPADQPDPWTDFCLSEADRVIAVAAGGSMLRPLRGGGALHNCELVGFGVEPDSGSIAHWIDALSPSGIHLVRGDRRLREDIARLARRLAGRSIGVVLSGGGARALAHLSVLEGLVAAGVRVDRVAGVGLGAFIGALLASGRDPAQMDACCREEWVRRRPFRDRTLAGPIPVRGARLQGMLRRVFADAYIEDLPCSFYSISVDLLASRLVIDRSGLVRDAVAGSLSLPPLAPPRRQGDQVLADGSLLEHLPVVPMSDTGEGPVIAVDVSTGHGPVDAFAGAVARATGRRRERRVPALSDSLVRVALLQSAVRAQISRRLADLVIDVRVPGLGLLGFDQIDFAREQGAVAVGAALADPPDWLLAPPPSDSPLGRPTLVRA